MGKMFHQITAEIRKTEKCEDEKTKEGSVWTKKQSNDECGREKKVDWNIKGFN